MKKQVGIWIDKREAKLVLLDGKRENFKIINSNIEEFHPKGGSGTAMKGGPQDVVQDSKYLFRENKQYKEFFKDISQNLTDSDELVIFGPAQSGERLHKELEESYPSLFQKVKGLEPADSMTDNQVKAWVRDFFSE